MNTFKAFVLENSKPVQTNIQEWTVDQLPEGEVLIQVAYSSVNYKDGLVGHTGNLAEFTPLVPGIDLAGTVVESSDPRYSKGDEVIATSYRIGTGHHGGFSEMARIPADWVVEKPEGLTLREAMILGTAGFTAALSVMQLEKNGLAPEQGPVLVVGASGGVGSLAVNMLSNRGYQVTAGTGKDHEHEYLKKLGATEIIHRDELVDKENKSIRKSKWAGAVDPVGGKTTQYILSSLSYGASVATSGLAGGLEVETDVRPFIGRGINWLGIDSVQCPMPLRKQVWQRLASDLKPTSLEDELVAEIGLQQLDQTFSDILEGKVKGRVLVKL
ncbi:acrylyl-CoA reductase family protein [Alkalicoccobacillus murimartini]|uniref:YhdH/YhfP family quinone oxidoreductase n=1 Tax=Alkalicoccobacillus murimartini TaxID=171685 RepID=A0ABT9YED9_9BACI|nr:acryloyl-CoA reductase [Alkalicoccobacillus murimartini]MDQ0206096.1 putative YhdH/YhfP family quinone oxidoreductase [Alkalicoccobacillus murimartini]